MKKFVILTYGFTPPTDEVQRAWGEWFKSAGPRLVTRAARSDAA
jgi:hypothetical protein